MKPPPTNLLLPQSFTFSDDANIYPLHVSSPSPSSVLAILLNHYAARHNLEEDDDKVHQKSVLINCYLSREAFIEALSKADAALTKFFCGTSTAKGKYLRAASRIDILHITSLQNLRSTLHTLSLEAVTGDDTFLGIVGSDVLHRLAGDFSAQGVAQTFAAAIDASGHRKLIYHDACPLTEPLDVLSRTTTMPKDLPSNNTVLDRVYQRWIQHYWTMPGKENAIWTSDDISWGVTWEESADGECFDIKLSDAL